MKKLFTVGLIFFLKTAAFSQGHYNGSSFNPGDYFAPHAGWIVPFYYGYAHMYYYNNDGKKADKLINPTPGNPTSLDIQQNVNTNSFILMAIYGGKKKVLGADWGMMVIPVLNNPTANIALDYYSNQTGPGSFKFTNKTWGFGDLYIQPVWLSWTKDKWSYGFTYGMWAPTGRYKPHDLDNAGLGYASHNIRVATRYKAPSKLSATLAATFELNHKQKESDFREAPHLTVDYGGTYLINKRGDEVGLFGHYTSQLGDDKGSSGSFLSDKIYGVGGFGSYWIKPHKIGVMMRVTQNFSARNRFSGTAVQAGFNFLFMK